MVVHREALNVRNAAFILVASAALAGAGACSVASDAPAPAACDVLLDPDPAFDLVLAGAGSCEGTLHATLRVATGDPAGPTWTPAGQGDVRVEGAWEARPGGAARSVTVHNAGSTPVELVGLEWTIADLPASFDRMLHEGYQSWSYTGVEPVPATLVERAGTAASGGGDGDVLGEVPGVSWWLGAVMDQRARGLVVGADGATVLKTYVAADGRRLRIVQGMTGDVVRLAPGESRSLDGLFVQLGDVRASLDDYAAHVAKKRPARAADRQIPLGGWGSWNLYYDHLSADALRPEISWAGAHLAPLGLSTFLTDDGYEPSWGTWSAKPSFGASLASYAGEQMAGGLVPALWLAPIHVDTSDPTFLAHPAWFVRRIDGNGALTYAQPDGTVKAALDVTQPEARSFLVSQLQQLWIAGYRVFKLDFLFGAAVEGRRNEPITSMESYARWMSATREAVPGAHLVGCGAPILPSVGRVDSMRIGADIAFVPAPEPYYPFVAAEARSAAHRAFTDAWWALDPDVVLLRGERITDDEAWTAVVMAALAGGNYMLGDARQAGELRTSMALAPAILALARDGRAARPEDLASEVDPGVIASPLLGGRGETAIPHVWRKSSADGTQRWTAVFGWLSDPYATDIDLEDGTVEILQPRAAGPVTTERIGRSGPQRLVVAGHSVRLFQHPR
ncbi:MAG: alpha-galactosidase [Labilithrix sp.]|nr:alpha-galactosidase [Labilithrix sp.]